MGRFKFCPEDGAPLLDSVPDPLIGRILNDKFEIVSRVGLGPLGVVYKSRHLLLEELRAIKILSTEALQSEDSPAKLRKAVTRAEALHSENTVRLFDLDRFENRYMIVEEFVEGDSLSSLLRSNEALPAEPALDILRQVCASLQEAHAHGICHFNLKPNNILLSKDGQGSSTGLVKVSDYGTGLIKEYRPFAWSHSDRASGITLYWAPEQLKGDALSPKTDVFALGLICYQMLTGELPDVTAGDHKLMEDRSWSGKLTEVLRAHHVEERVQDLIVRMLRTSPDHRPALEEIARVGTMSAAPVHEEPAPQPIEANVKMSDAAEITTASQPVATSPEPHAAVEASRQTAPAEPAEVPAGQPEGTVVFMSDVLNAKPAAGASLDGKEVVSESPRGPGRAAAPEKPAQLVRWLKYTWLLPLLVLAPMVVMIVLRSHSPAITDLLSSWDLGPEFILMFVLMCTAMLILVYAYWLVKTKENKSTNVPARRPRPGPGRPALTVVTTAAPATGAPERTVTPPAPAMAPVLVATQSPVVETPVAKVPDDNLAPSAPTIVTTPVVEAQERAVIPPAPPAVVAASSGLGLLFNYADPAARKSAKLTWAERFALLKPDFKAPKTQASLFHYVKPAESTDENWGWKERVALLKPDLRGPKTQPSLFNYIKPPVGANEKLSWKESLALLKPDFKEPKTQASLFHYVKEEGDERDGTEVELSPEIAQLLAERSKSRAPNLISSLFEDASEVDQAIGNFRRRRALIGMFSVAFHAAIIVLLVVVLLIKPTVPEIAKPEQVTVMVAPPPPRPMIFQTKADRDGGGGGGGGRREPTPPSPGRLPKTTKEVQLLPPDPTPRPMTSKDTFMVDQTVVVPIEIAQDKTLPIGDITAPKEKTPPSSGPGSEAGIGTGKGGGLGPGRGPGVGPGSGGGIGGGDGGGVGSGHGPYVAGMAGIRNPVLIYGPPAAYTEAGIRAKVTDAVVVLVATVRSSGKVDNIRVVKRLGYGLDESAVNTVQTKWKFQPGTKNGQPVDVEVTIEVKFRML
jgi:TonB family protein